MKKIVLAFLFFMPAAFVMSQQQGYQQGTNLSKLGLQRVHVRPGDTDAWFKINLQNDNAQAISQMKNVEVEYNQFPIVVKRIEKSKNGCDIGIMVTYTPAQATAKEYVDQMTKAGVMPGTKPGDSYILSSIEDWRIETRENCSLQEIIMDRSLMVSPSSGKIQDAVQVYIIMEGKDDKGNTFQDKPSFFLSNMNDKPEMQISFFVS